MQDSENIRLESDLHPVPVIDLDAFRMLEAVLGQHAMARMARSFFADAERRLALLEQEHATPVDLRDHAHAMVSMAGHFGLQQLSTLCMDLQERARANGGLEGRPAMRRAVARAQKAVDAAVSGGTRLGADQGGPDHPARSSSEPAARADVSSRASLGGAGSVASGFRA